MKYVPVIMFLLFGTGGLCALLLRLVQRSMKAEQESPGRLDSDMLHVAHLVVACICTIAWVLLVIVLWP